MTIRGSAPIGVHGLNTANWQTEAREPGLVFLPTVPSLPVCHLPSHTVGYQLGDPLCLACHQYVRHFHIQSLRLFRRFSPLGSYAKKWLNKRKE